MAFLPLSLSSSSLRHFFSKEWFKIFQALPPRAESLSLYA